MSKIRKRHIFDLKPIFSANMKLFLIMASDVTFYTIFIYLEASIGTKLNIPKTILDSSHDEFSFFDKSEQSPHRLDLCICVPNKNKRISLKCN